MEQEKPEDNVYIIEKTYKGTYNVVPMPREIKDELETKYFETVGEANAEAFRLAVQDSKNSK